MSKNKLAKYSKELTLCLAMIDDIYSDTVKLLKENDRKVTDAKLLSALVELSIEQAEFRFSIQMPLDKAFDSQLKQEIKKQYFQRRVYA